MPIVRIINLSLNGAGTLFVLKKDDDIIITIHRDIPQYDKVLLMVWLVQVDVCNLYFINNKLLFIYGVG